MPTAHPAGFGVRGHRDQEYLPALSADGTLLFFTRAGERKAKGDLVSKPFEKVHLGKAHRTFRRL